jgi:hypothetical protein
MIMVKAGCHIVEWSYLLLAFFRLFGDVAFRDCQRTYFSVFVELIQFS